MNNSQIRLGELLSKCLALSELDVNRALKLSKLSGLSLGKCFVLLDYVSEEQLKAFIEAQALLRENVFTEKRLLDALGRVIRQNWSLSDALVAVGCDVHRIKSSRLGELLRDASVISSVDLEFALRAAGYSSLQLGKVLTCFNSDNQPLVNEALILQSEVRKGSREREAAITILEGLKFHLPSQNQKHFRLGEILTRAAIVTESQMDKALGEAAKSQNTIGSYLVSTGKLTESTLFLALSVQDLLDARLISIESACSIVREVSVIESKFASHQSAGVSLFDFLRATNYLTVKKRQYLMLKMTEMFSNDMTMIKKKLTCDEDMHELLLSEFKDDSTIINAGVVLHQLVTKEKMTLTQALLAFSLRHREISPV